MASIQETDINAFRADVANAEEALAHAQANLEDAKRRLKERLPEEPEKPKTEKPKAEKEEAKPAKKQPAAQKPVAEKPKPVFPASFPTNRAPVTNYSGRREGSR